MKKLLLILLSAVALCACNPTSENPPHEEPPRPENAISTLNEDLELHFGDATTLVYADCFGDWYKTGLYMWQLYFMEFERTEQLCIELIVESNELAVPTGTFALTPDLHKSGILQGITEDGFDDRSWYMRLNSSGKVGDKAPIAGGSITITANDNGTHTATFALEDDAFNKITGSYTGIIIVEDFR